ncbi:MAG TPA: hypothetical protein VGB20_04220 [bacterium]
MTHRIRGERGAVLGLMIILAFVAAIVAYGNVMMAISQSRQSQWWHERPPARYAAEAGLVIAQERLWANPNYCASNDVVPIDVDGNGSTTDPGDLSVAITVQPCGSPTRTITTKVVY